MGYEIASINRDCIFIKHECRDELDGFIMLLKSIEGDVSGRITQLDSDDAKYTIQGDPYELVFSLDSSGGIAVTVKNIQDIDSVVDMLNSHFEQLNC